MTELHLCECWMDESWMNEDWKAFIRVVMGRRVVMGLESVPPACHEGHEGVPLRCTTVIAVRIFELRHSRSRRGPICTAGPFVNLYVFLWMVSGCGERLQNLVD